MSVRPVEKELSLGNYVPTLFNHGRREEQWHDEIKKVRTGKHLEVNVI